MPSWDRIGGGEPYQEPGDQYREQEARRKYRLSHPLVEKEEIDYLQPILELIDDYFSKNPEAQEFQLSKGSIQRSWDMGYNQSNRKISEICDQYEFLKDSKKGYIIIDRKIYEEWVKTTEQLRKIGDINDSQVEYFSDLKRKLDEKIRIAQGYQEAVSKIETDYKDLQVKEAQLMTKIGELDWNNYLLEERIISLKKQINHLEPQLIRIKEIVDGLNCWKIIIVNGIKHKSFIWKALYEKKILVQMGDIFNFIYDTHRDIHKEFTEIHKLKTEIEEKENEPIVDNKDEEEVEYSGEHDFSEDDYNRQENYDYEYEDYQNG